jgi:hypothetical protein
VRLGKLEPFYVENFQMVNLSFLRLQLAKHCRNCGGVVLCQDCEIQKIKTYLNDPGQSADEVK